MTDKERLYETLGELLYAVALADGVIQQQEKDMIESILKDHPWAGQIKWSFDYERTHGMSVKEVYKKAISFCQSYGPAPEYADFIDAMRLVAMAADGIDAAESGIIENFSKDLIAQFQKDIDRLKETE